MNRVIVIAFLALAIPQITFAAWWNPISWFKKPETKVEILGDKVKELETSINNNPTTTQSTETPPLKKVKTKIVPNIGTVAPVEDLEIKLQREILEAKQRIEAQLKIDAEKEQTRTLQTQEWAQIPEEKSLDANLMNTLTQEYETRVFAINQQILDLKNKYYKDIQAIQNNSYMSGSVKTGLAGNMANEVNTKIDKLNLEIEQLRLGYTIKMNQLQLNQEHLKGNTVPSTNTKSTLPSTKIGVPTAGA